MKKYFFLSFCLTVSLISYSQKVINVSLIGTISKETIFEQTQGFPGMDDVIAYKVLYETEYSNTIDTASGLLVIPSSYKDTTYSIIAYQHGTARSREDVPSNFGLEALLAFYLSSQNYIVVAADYIGLGESKKKTHPYLHANSEAAAGIDLLLAAKTFMAENEISYNDQLFITGYSQGGHAGMAMHKEIESNYSNQLNVTAASHMSGPYNLSKQTLSIASSDVIYTFPSYLIWNILGYQSIYGNIYDKLEDVFKPNFIPIIKEFEENLITRVELNEFILLKLFDDFGQPIPKLILRDSFLFDVKFNPNNSWKVALKENDVFNWKPVSPTRLMYCSADEQVFSENATFTDSIMLANGASDVMAIDVNPFAFHDDCLIPSMLNTLIFFKENSNLQAVSNRNISTNLGFQISPNPATDYIELIFNHSLTIPENLIAHLYNINGQIVRQFNVNYSGKRTFYLNGVPDGMYILKLQSANGYWAEKITVQN